MQKITVAKVSSKPTSTGRTLITITDNSGALFSTFDTHALELNKGDVIEAEVKIKGQFHNLDEFNVLSQAQPSPGIPTAIKAITQSEITLRKAEIVAQLWAADKLNEEHPLVARLLTWLAQATKHYA